MTGDGGSLALQRAGEVPEARLYAKLVTEADGAVSGQWRRRREAEFELWELPGGTVVRYRRTLEDRVVEEHLFDASGAPLVSVWLGADGPERAVLATVPPREVSLAGFAAQGIPGGTMWLPGPPAERPGGGIVAQALGGEVAVWTDPPADVYADPFRDGLLAGCGCEAIDRATAWVDGRPGVRYRLRIPGEVAEVVDLWAVPLGDATWLLAFRAPAGEDPVAAVLPARALVAGVDFEEAAG